MRNLVFSNITRLKKSKLFWAGIILSMGYSLFLLIMNFYERLSESLTAIENLNWYFLSPFSFTGMFCAVFCAIFLGTEYNDGTIRNKLIAGYSKSTIYFANLLTIFFASLTIYISACIIVMLIGIPLFGCNFVYPIEFTFMVVSGILMIAAFSGLFTMLSMTIDNKAFAVTACLISYALLFVCSSFLRISVFANYQTSQVTGTNSFLQFIIGFIYDFLPTGQSFQISSGLVLHPSRLPIYSIISILLTFIVGLCLFSKKDVK